MRSFLAMCVLSSVRLIAQQTWLVNCQNLPGTDFLDLPQAVAAASPGDTILLYDTCSLAPATWYNATTIDKPLRIVGFPDGAGPPPGSAVGPGAALVRGRFTITGIPAGGQVLLSNLLVRPVIGPSGFFVDDCDGQVVLEDVVCSSGNWPDYVLRIHSSSDVTLRGCALKVAGSPLEIVDSDVLITTTLIEQDWHNAPTNPPGMLLQNSTVTMIGSIVEGFPNTSLSISNATSGAVLHDSTLRIGPASTLYGGVIPPGSRTYGYWAPNPLTSVVELDLRGTIDEIGTWLQPQPTQTAIDATFHSWVTADQLYGVTVAGPSNGFALLLFGDLIPPTPTPFGPLSIDPLSAYGVDLVPLPASNGSHWWIFLCPPDAPVAQGFAFQALTLSPFGTLGLTVPSPLTVAWPLGVVPQ